MKLNNLNLCYDHQFRLKRNYSIKPNNREEVQSNELVFS